VTAYARRRTANWTEADDVVSDTFATAWRRRGELDPGRPALPWLYGIAANVIRNQARSHHRRLRLVTKLEQSEPLPLGPDPAEQPGAEVRAALTRLSDDDQEVLRLAAWEGLSHAEIGQALGCTTNAVGIRLHRARQRLQTELTLTTEAEDLT
jgi:RNA polymerase sigma-70 factor (ECF subfamily)